MMRILTAVGALSAAYLSQAACPEGYEGPVPAEGAAYQLRSGDAKSSSGRWYNNQELALFSGAVLDGADWYVDGILAAQNEGSCWDLKSGTVTWTASPDNWGGGVYPDHNGNWINFMPGSTARCIVTHADFTPEKVFEKCFSDSSSNFRYNNERLTDKARFEELFTVEANATGGSTFYLKPSNDVFFDTVTVNPVADAAGAVRLEAKFLNAGDGTATIAAAWDVADKGTNPADWPQKIELGTLEDFLVQGGRLEGLEDGVTYAIRLFATEEEKTTCSACVSATLYRGLVVIGSINRWIGGEGSYDEAANWSLGHVPQPNEVRWVEDGVIDCTQAIAFTPNPQDMFIGGRMVVKELQPNYPGITLRGTTFECVIIAPQGELPPDEGFNVSAGSIIVTGTDNDGFWRTDNRHLNLTRDSTAVLVFPFAASRLYDLFIANGKVRYCGMPITREDFDNPEKWTVSAFSDTTSSLRKTVAVDGAPTLDEPVLALDDTADTTVLVTVRYSSSTPLLSAALKYGPSMGDLSRTVTAADPNPADRTLRFTVTGLTRKTKHYFAVVVENDVASVESTVKGAVTYAPVFPEAVWIGGGDAQASNPDNWLPAAVPTAESKIEVLDTMATGLTLDWDLPTGVKSWTQSSSEGRDVRVVLHTTAENAFEVAENLTVLSGRWSVPRTAQPGVQPTAVLHVKVGGALMLGSAAIFHAGRGYNNESEAGSGWLLGAVDSGWVGGPGYVDIGGEDLEHWPLYGRGASFGGDGGYRTADFVILEPTKPGEELARPAYTLPLKFISYGRILDPLDWGSSGHGDNANFAGGGVVKLVVGGALTLDGKIESVGFGYSGLNNTADHNGTAGASSGGSINITAATLTGSGSVNADGGCDELGGGGSGGRIRVKLTGKGATFDDSRVDFHAWGGAYRDGVYYQPVAHVVDAASGTIALQKPEDDEKSGTVIIRGKVRSLNDQPVPVGATHFPSRKGGEKKLSGVRLVVEPEARVRLTRNVTVASLVCGGNPVRCGVYTVAELNKAAGAEMFVADGGEQMRVGAAGLMIILR